MKNNNTVKQLNKIRRIARVRSKIFGTATTPRLAVFRSLQHIAAQLINDELGRTIVSANDSELKDVKKKTKTEIAQAIGELIAKKAIEKNISAVVFDRRSYTYHGRIKALADGARAGGLKF